MSKINFEKTDNNLILNYEAESDWIEDQIEDNSVRVYRTFNFEEKDLLSKEGDYKYKFILGEKEKNYYKIDRSKIETNFDLYIDVSLEIDESWFVTYLQPRIYKDSDGELKSTSMYGNILYVFKEFYAHDSLYIDKDTDETFNDDGLHVTKSTYEQFVKLFPTATYTKYLKLSLFTNILKTELDVVDYESLYERYKTRAIKVREKGDIIPKAMLQNEKQKFLFAKEQLEENLRKVTNGEFVHEDDFSKIIAQFFCLLNPKYIKVYEKLNISDYTGVRKNSQVDMCLVDCDGNIDIIEVKSPYAYPNLFRKRPYRNHYVPCGELNGAINQLEQYLKSLTKMSKEEISSKNPKLQKQLGDIKLKAIHPKGYIIFGRYEQSFNGNSAQKKIDFELIRNTYRDVVDILTFDDLINRFDAIISHL